MSNGHQLNINLMFFFVLSERVLCAEDGLDLEQDVHPHASFPCRRGHTLLGEILKGVSVQILALNTADQGSDPEKHVHLLPRTHTS